MTAVKLRPSLHDRIAALETRSEGQDKKIAGMADQVGEIYDAWRKLKTINWFVVKVVTSGAAALGAVAVVLTIIEKTGALIGHH